MALIPQVYSDIMDDTDPEEEPKPKIETDLRSTVRGSRPHIQALLSEAQYKKLRNVTNSHDLTVIAWRQAFGNQVFERAYSKALRLLRASHPKGLKHLGSARSKGQRDRLAERLRDQKDLADIFNATYDGPHQREFYQDVGPRGLILLANKYIHNVQKAAKRVGKEADEDSRASIKMSKHEIRSTFNKKAELSRAAKQQKETTMSSNRRKSSQFPSSRLLAEVEPSDGEYLAYPEPAKDQGGSWQLWVYKASDKSFVVAMEMEDVFGKRQPQKSDVKYEKIHQCLDRHPDLQSQDLKQGLVYVDEVRNYPVYDTITLKFAFEKWRNSGPRPNFLLYLDDRTRTENQPRQSLPCLEQVEQEDQEEQEVEHMSENEDIDHGW